MVATDGSMGRNLNYEERSWGNGVQVAGYRLGLDYWWWLFIVI